MVEVMSRFLSSWTNTNYEGAVYYIIIVFCHFGIPVCLVATSQHGEAAEDNHVVKSGLVVKTIRVETMIPGRTVVIKRHCTVLVVPFPKREGRWDLKNAFVCTVPMDATVVFGNKRAKIEDITVGTAVRLTVRSDKVVAVRILKAEPSGSLSP